MYFTSLGLAVPDRSFAQAEVLQALESDATFATLTEKSRNLLRKVLSGKNGIQRRHLALEEVREAFDFRPDAMMARFRKHAPNLAAHAARKALENARLQPDQIDALFVATCTGYLCPGLSSYVAETLGLPVSASLLDLVGQGCGAALPALDQAAVQLQAGRARRVLVVCVEICSAASYLDDDPGVLISACLFGDGAAAAVLGSEPASAGPFIRWAGSARHSAPEHREHLRFDHRQGLLRNLLSAEVPSLSARHARTVFDRACATHGRNPAEVSGWIWHAGGREVLRALRREFHLTEKQTEPSASVLLRHGNMSSPSCLFALDHALRNGVPDGLWWLASFGAGFSSFGAFLEVRR
ncbi:stilbene synthase [bacterium]|nr:stilbene synthase [bacterium]